MSAKKKRKLTRKQAKLVVGLAQGKSGAQAARDAGYAADSARQAAYQTRKAIEGRAREALDAKGYTFDQIIDIYLHPLLEAKETKFFPWRKGRGRNAKQIIDKREVEALGTRCFAVDALFKLRGDYAPKQIDFDPEANAALRVIDTSSIPSHG